MSRKPGFFIICHGKNTKDPLHYRGQAFFMYWFYQEMNVIPHYAEIIDLKRIFLMGPPDNRQKQLLNGIGIKEHLFSICARCNRVASAREKLLWYSHAKNTRKYRQLD